MSEHEFIEQLKSNEALLTSVCRNYCYSYSRQDLMQDIALELWQSISNFKNSCKFSTWMYAVARNVCVNTLRKQKKQPSIEDISEYSDTLVELDNRPELVKQLQQAMRYNSVLDTIEEPYRTLFHLHIYGATYNELEQRSGIPANTIRVRVYRIKRQLQLRYGSQVI